MNWRSIKVGAIAALALIGLLISGTAVSQRAQPTQKRADPISESDVAYRFRFFETTNIWTFILLEPVMNMIPTE